MHKILIYLHIIHLLKSSTCFELYPAHLREVYVVIVYMQPLVSPLAAGDCLVHRLRKNQGAFSLFTDILIKRFRVRIGLKLGMVNLVVACGP